MVQDESPLLKLSRHISIKPSDSGEVGVSAQVAGEEEQDERESDIEDVDEVGSTFCIDYQSDPDHSRLPFERAKSPITE